MAWSQKHNSLKSKFGVGDLVSYSYPHFNKKNVLGIVIRVPSLTSNVSVVYELKSMKVITMSNYFLTLKSVARKDETKK